MGTLIKPIRTEDENKDNIFETVNDDIIIYETIPFLYDKEASTIFATRRFWYIKSKEFVKEGTELFMAGKISDSSYNVPTKGN